MYAVIPPGRNATRGYGDPDSCFDGHAVRTRVSLRYRDDTYLLVYDDLAYNRGGVRNMIAEKIIARAGRGNAVVFGVCTLQKWTYDANKRTSHEDTVTADDIRDLLR